MNFRILAKINFDKLLSIIVIVLILIYLGIGLIKQVNISQIKKGISLFRKEISLAEVYDYISNHSNYYYEIEDSIYCITKDELKSSNEISQTFIDNMQGDIIEAKYENNMFTLSYNDNCIPR